MSFNDFFTDCQAQTCALLLFCHRSINLKKGFENFLEVLLIDPETRMLARLVVMNRVARDAYARCLAGPGQRRVDPDADPPHLLAEPETGPARPTDRMDEFPADRSESMTSAATSSPR